MAVSGVYCTFACIGSIFSASLTGIAFGGAATDHGLHVVAWFICVIGTVNLLKAVLDRTIPARAWR
ncbi:hypothetical protein [Catenulispora pinisilvae]|uniref:hypothetical protein n=1 Tax=Catenulispora pinisilvae TaxID=2705253 RepID=UPI001891FA8E|nr:hypothetical protein [Catenulispora pinisilvae]